MAKYVKPELLNLVWASDALPADKPSPDSSGEFSGTGITVDVAEGWTRVKPPYQVENWIQNQQSQFNAYVNQLGVPEWDTVTEYQAGKSYIQGSDNRIYRCILTHSGRNPASGNPSYWELFEGNRQATTTARGTVELATTAEAQAGTSDSLAVTPSGLRGVLEVLFPVGSVAIRPSNPGNSIANGGLGFGTWSRIQGRTIRGAGTTTDKNGKTRAFDVGQEPGGVFAQTLTVSELPPHRHTGTTSEHTHGHSTNWKSGAEGDNPSDVLTAGDNGRLEGTFTAWTGSDTHYHYFSTSYEGDGREFDVTDPYIVVDMWRRTT